MGITPEKVREIVKVSQDPVSLETPIGEEEDSHLGDFVEDREAVSPSDAASLTMLHSEVEDVLDTLTPRERRVPPSLDTRSTTRPRHRSVISTAATTAGITPVWPTMSGLAKLTTANAYPLPISAQKRVVTSSADISGFLS